MTTNETTTTAIVITSSDVKTAVVDLMKDLWISIHDLENTGVFLTICNDRRLVMTDGNGVPYTEAQLLQAYAELRVEVLTYNQLLGRYRKLLEVNPGKALFIGRFSYVALDEDAYLYGICRRDDQSFAKARTYDFDRENYNTCTGGWDSESYIETWRHIQAPVFVDLVDRTSGW